MRKQLGRGVGSWTASKDAEFSNFIWGNNDFHNNMRERLIEKARIKALSEKARLRALARLKALKEDKIDKAEANTKDDDVVSDAPTPNELELLEKQRMLELRMKKPPYLLYGGIGLVVIVGAIFIFTRK